LVGFPEIASGVHYVGVQDWNTKIFDALIPLPQGTTYNSYLVKGKDKTALIDTVKPGFERELEDKINQIHSVHEIDYIVMNHAEPDHAGAIPYIMEVNEDAILVTSRGGKKPAQIYFQVPEDRIKTVLEGETLELGGKTLKFIDAPMLHWPETMFTYLEKDKILFPCDFMGLHTAYGSTDADVDELIPFAKRYFGEIMMPTRAMGKQALGKLDDLDISVIAPSHGPVHYSPEIIMEHYEKWTSGETERKVIVVYVSMWGSTEKMIKAMVETLTGEGVDVRVYNLLNADVGDIGRDLVDSRGIVLGVPTVLKKMHPLAVFAAHLVGVLKPPLRYGVVLSSYGWSKGALNHAAEVLGPTGIEVVGALEVNGPPGIVEFEEIRKIGLELASKVLVE
jgi:flavorubredoxin